MCCNVDEVKGDGGSLLCDKKKRSTHQCTRVSLRRAALTKAALPVPRLCRHVAQYVKSADDAMTDDDDDVERPLFGAATLRCGPDCIIPSLYDNDRSFYDRSIHVRVIFPTS